MIVGRPPSMTAAAEFDVPKSIPIAFAILTPPLKLLKIL
jgi:hypothetical protein